MGNNTFQINATSHQYKTVTYTTKDGRICTGIHVFTTLGKDRQSLVPLINPSKRVQLSSMSPNRSVALPESVIAKINGNVFNYDCPLGINYEGSDGNLYISGDKYSAPPPNDTFPYKNKYHPSFCVKKDGTAVIRWFENAKAMKNAMDACRCIIGAAHPLVFGGKCVTDDATVRDNEPANMIICNKDDQTNCRFNFTITAAQPKATALRTCLGHKSGSDGIYIMVCTDSHLTLDDAANLMKLLGCDYAVNLDGNGSVQMRIKNGYGANGKVTAASGDVIYAGVAVYTV